MRKYGGIWNGMGCGVVWCGVVWFGVVLFILYGIWYSI